MNPDSNDSPKHHKILTAWAERYSSSGDTVSAKLPAAVVLCGRLSPFVAQQLRGNQAFFEDYFSAYSISQPPPLEELRQEYSTRLASQTNLNAAKSILRQWRNRVMTIIAMQRLCDFTPIEQEMHSLSVLADQLISAAYQWSYQQMVGQWGQPLAKDKTPMHLLILAMGKYGGYELNFSSDVDLIFFYHCDGVTQGSGRTLEHQTFFTRLGQMLIALLADVTGDGQVFRVDMRLRPYGDSGPLAMSFDAAEDYYQEQGREWERFAMIKARPITGTEQERAAFYGMIAPFVYRRYIDFGVLESIRAMKKMIQSEVRRRSLQDNIKLGSGGIREAEFIVQSLQLIRGGRVPELRERSFFSALRALTAQGVIKADIAATVGREYRFLRQVEHIMQALRDEQTQTLPDAPELQALLAAILGLESYQECLSQLDASRQIIHHEFIQAFRLERDEATNLEHDHLPLSGLEEDDLAAFFPDWSSATIAELMRLIKTFTGSNAFQKLSDTGRNRLNAFFPKLMQSLIQSRDPVVTLERILGLLRSINRRTAYLVLLEENPPILEHLVKLCDQSAWVSERLAEHPILLDELLYPNALYTPLTDTELADELRVQLLRIEPDDEEQQQEQLRIFKQTHELRVAAAVLNQTINVRKASRYLSQIASAIVAAVLNFSWQKLCERYGPPHLEADPNSVCPGFAIVGYGKFGGEELGFGSDLDVVFLYQAEAEALTAGERPISNAQFFTRLAQRIISSLNMRTLSGVLYEVDTRLRPSGNSGLLVSHIDAFQDYQKNEAWTWEHQALTRARVVAGDQTIADWFGQLRRSILAQPREPKILASEVVKMRAKMRSSLDQSTPEAFDIKQGLGMMVDIEFIAQYVVLKHASNQASAIDWPTRTTRQLLLAAQYKLLDSAQVASLVEAYRFYRESSNLLLLRGESKLLSRALTEPHRAAVLAVWQHLFNHNDDGEFEDVESSGQ
ncbi:MAG: bifunctional [glutamate--ammonia ligase]-adenylyl-L-tyrosine phosphorylase/[glutamate--ammonia-ligase] adenylyltransferase [Gammaproteobacteria bacterium]|nr:bifunctional [glutamate--ammonia ligase]-adenylyl-L-tyrosine phosphorylase/[glutamate--ammonia-ligase] adenylyltransferase [Gammaproteobacteria bacterium]